MKLPTPEEVRATFTRLMEESPEQAVRYLHDLGTSSGYLNEEAIAKNIHWTASSPYGDVECTINLAKPEKDPRAIAAEASESKGRFGDPNTNALSDSQSQPSNPLTPFGVSQTETSPLTQNKEPQCDLCWENEEFPGTPEHPAKPGLRIVPLNLGRECWGLQYSPYAYFDEHCIALSKEHRPLKIDAGCLVRLLDFVDLFPFYFIGANADLPIVGGSILSHDHFQGGRHEFPLMKAPLKHTFSLEGLPAVQCGIVDWPASVVRLISDNRAELLEAATQVLAIWHEYSDEACNIIAATNGVQHNTLNPIVRKQGAVYTMDLVLRNNRADAEHPWGIFHAPEWTHYIKKENIGLIEIMGLAILPPRLLTELQPLNQQEVAEVFLAILEATGVFKHDTRGTAAWDTFIHTLQTKRAETP